jgi:hypothetical protein
MKQKRLFSKGTNYKTNLATRERGGSLLQLNIKIIYSKMSNYPKKKERNFTALRII